MNQVLPRHPRLALRRIDVYADIRAFSALGYRTIPTTVLVDADGEYLDDWGILGPGELEARLRSHGY